MTGLYKKAYYAMNIDFAELLLRRHPKAALYDDGKIVLTGDYPEGFEGQEVDLYSEGFDPDGTGEGLSITQLNARVNVLRANNPQGKLTTLSLAQGQWLYANHPAFMPAVTE